MPTPKAAKARVETLISISVFILVLILAAFLLMKNISDNDKDGEEEKVDTQLTTSDIILLANEDPKVGKLGGFEIQYEGGWEAVSKIRATQYETYTCQKETGDLCDIHILTKTDDKNYFFVSSDSPLKPEGGSLGELTTKEVNLSGIALTLNFEKYMVFNEDESGNIILDEQSSAIRQIFGCTENGLCISSGLLEMDPETNSTQLKIFNEFVASIKILNAENAN